MNIEKFDLDVLRVAIANERMQRRLTQEQVATALGCTRRWVSNFERGRGRPEIELVVAYANLMKMEILMRITPLVDDFDRPSGENALGAVGKVLSEARVKVF